MFKTFLSVAIQPTPNSCFPLPQASAHRRRVRTIAAQFAGVMLAAALGDGAAGAGEVPNPFFAMDTGTRDATHHTPVEQVALVKETGFTGFGPTYHGVAELKEWFAALDQDGLKMFALYLPLRLDEPAASLASIQEAANALRGHDTLLWLTVTDATAKPSGTNHDEAAVKALREIARMAKDAGLRVALYPHAGLYVQRVEDAVRLAEKTGCTNLGVTFNLCHWLKVDGQDLEASLRTAQPHLFCVTLNGADRGGADWKKLIQPLDRGTYDVGRLLRLLHRMNYTGPIGLQHYGIGGDARENLRHSMAGWRKLSIAATTTTGDQPP